MESEDDFHKRMKEAKSWAAVERDSLFAHAEETALDVDKAWEFGFLQGWMMCLLDQVKKRPWHDPKRDRNPPEEGREVYDDHTDR